jgi:hypothetical protein
MCVKELPLGKAAARKSSHQSHVPREHRIATADG